MEVGGARCVYDATVTLRVLEFRDKTLWGWFTGCASSVDPPVALALTLAAARVGKAPAARLTSSAASSRCRSSRASVSAMDCSRVCRRESRAGGVRRADLQDGQE